MAESEGSESYPGDVHKGVVAGGIDEVGLMTLRCDTICCKQLPWAVCLILYEFPCL